MVLTGNNSIISRRWGMDQQRMMAKHLMDLQRTTFEGMINNMIIYWDQTERMLGSYLQQAVWVPADGKKAFGEWIEGNRKGCETFKDAVNNGFKRLESCLVVKP
jgi:hypothetical protein